MTLTMQPRQRAAGLLMISLLTIMGAAGCGSKKQDPSTGGDPGRAIRDAVIPVEIAVAEQKALTVTKKYTGSLEGEEQAAIIPKLSERITAVRVRVGEAVRAGQAILELDRGGASSQYFQANANFQNADKTLRRMKSLYEEGAISLQVLDGAQTAYDVAKANFEAAKSAVELTTPITGRVTALNANIGDLAVPGAALATVARINRMKVIFNVNESDVPSLAVGQQVRVYSDAQREAEAVGRITQLSKSADIRSRTFEIRALFPNTRDQWFKPGMYCRVDVQLAPATGSLVVPNAAIQSDGISSRVFVVRNGRSLQRQVSVGISDGNFSAILSGLAERDTVITTGATSAKDSGYVSIAGRTGEQSPAQMP